jgi:hypothetical protein
MRRLVLLCVLAVATLTAPPALAAPTIRLAIIHFVQGCHVWGTVDSQPLGPTRTIVLTRGAQVQIRVNCPMTFDLTQVAGPRIAGGTGRIYPGTVRTVTFARAGVYRFQAVNVQSSSELGLQTMGADNTLVLTVRVK